MLKVYFFLICLGEPIPLTVRNKVPGSRHSSSKYRPISEIIVLTRPHMGC
jgi:hypothetical protein